MAAQLETGQAPAKEPTPSVQRATVVAVAGVGLIATLAAAAFLTTRSGADHDTTTPSAVDIGFARDMRVHHQQAVLMAAYTREHAESEQVHSLAGVIESAQQREIGQMVGWLQSWDQPESSDEKPMAWMHAGAAHSMQHHGGGGASMPGMATPRQLDRLVNLTGRELDIEFLQLMTRHHQGGVLMAKYASGHAHLPYVRDVARLMIQDQQREIDQMQVLLRAACGDCTSTTGLGGAAARVTH